MRFPDLFEKMRYAFSLAMQRSVGVGTLPSVDLLLSALEAFDIEDDGSVEWLYMVDLIVMISAAIAGQEVSACLDTALRSYLDGVFNALVRSYAVADGRPISYSEAKKRLAGDAEWGRAVEFISAL